MTDKLVTHEDLPAITALEREWSAAGFEGLVAAGIEVRDV